MLVSLTSFTGPRPQNFQAANTFTIWDEIEDRVYIFKVLGVESRQISEISEDFSEFYSGFLRDMKSQKRSVDFDDFLGVIGECDTTIILNSNNWEYTNWDFREFFDVENDSEKMDGWNNVYYASDTTFYYEFVLNEVGVIYQVGFEKFHNKWLLRLYYVNAC